ncbi:acyltransferase [Paraburkholderia caledonica]|jgi:peptidoglycan/LPS O-acetylase OafA/YrhL|uniref:acyltransferase family protein n=1 Tax=Paraburkholderia caledonica TaxID=134536 RepID=UPI0038B83C05
MASVLKASASRPLRLSHGENNFDLLRLLAALAVMFGHSFYIQPFHGRVEPILKHTGLEYSGSLAVYTFFFISGLLVSSSFDRQASLGRFVTLRLARIYPGLLFCVCVTSFALYPLVSNLGFWSTLTSEAARQYFLANVLLFNGIQWTLPKLFDAAALKNVVNGSLWTLPLELKCYLLVVIAGLLGCFRSKSRIVAFSIVVGIAFAYVAVNGSSFEFLRNIVQKPTGYSFYALPFFLLGMFAYAFIDRIKVNWIVGLVLLAVYALVRTSAIAAPFFYVAFIYVLLLFAVSPALRQLNPTQDYSYGVYLWAFPMQQVVATHFPTMDNLLGLCISVPMTVVAAMISWHLVEKPAIAVGRGIASMFGSGRGNAGTAP